MEIQALNCKNSKPCGDFANDFNEFYKGNSDISFTDFIR